MTVERDVVGYVVLARNRDEDHEYTISPLRPTRAFAEQEMAAAEANNWTWIAGYRIGVVHGA